MPFLPLEGSEGDETVRGIDGLVTPPRRRSDRYGLSRFRYVFCFEMPTCSGSAATALPDLLAKNFGHTNCCGRARPPMPLKAHRRCLADIGSFYAADAGGTSERNPDG